MDLTVVFIGVAIYCAAIAYAFLRKDTMGTKIFTEGDALVTGTGEIVIDEVIPRSRALIVNPETYITVEFDPNEPPPPPCAGGAEDELDWELFLRHPHVFSREEELKLKITWTVQSARTIIWRIKVPV